MMKGLVLSFLLIISFTLINGKCVRKEILSISSGTSFGRCIGYCRRSISIKSTPTYELIAFKEPNYVQPAYPSVEKNYSFSSNQWKQMISLVDAKSFQNLDDRIGCPDCADGGAEWIEIQWLNTTKRVTFERGQLIKGFEGLINELRNLRDEYGNNS